MRKPNEIVINNRTLEQILKEHNYADLEGVDLEDADLRHADLRYDNLRDANLTYANLRYADLRSANLRGANLRGANLEDADLKGADLRGANLSGVDLEDADLRGANLRDANLRDAILEGVNLRYADLRGANLRDAILGDAILSYADLRGAKGNLIEYRNGKILTEDIIGYKKCQNEIIVTLLIPRGAIMFSINGKKCRTNRAKVIAIDGVDRAYSEYNGMSYYVGDEFNIYNFNCQYNVECGEGIHFFMTRKEAERY